jgi:hypothetical protein
MAIKLTITLNTDPGPQPTDHDDLAEYVGQRVLPLLVAGYTSGYDADRHWHTGDEPAHAITVKVNDYMDDKLQLPIVDELIGRKDADEAYDRISVLFSTIENELARTMEADAHPEAAANHARLTLLRMVDDCIQSTIDDMRTERSFHQQVH